MAFQALHAMPQSRILDSSLTHLPPGLLQEAHGLAEVLAHVRGRLVDRVLPLGREDLRRH